MNETMNTTNNSTAYDQYLRRGIQIPEVLNEAPAGVSYLLPQHLEINPFNSMNDNSVRVTKRQIGDTLYIIESTSSISARETVCEKVKRLILGSTPTQELKIAS